MPQQITSIECQTFIKGSQDFEIGNLVITCTYIILLQFSDFMLGLCVFLTVDKCCVCTSFFKSSSEQVIITPVHVQGSNLRNLYCGGQPLTCHPRKCHVLVLWYLLKTIPHYTEAMCLAHLLL